MSERRGKQFYSVFCCPHCFALAAVNRTLPSEALGVHSYTDGLVIEPSFIDTPSIARCGSCHHFYWCDDGDAAFALRRRELSDAEYAAEFAGANWIDDLAESEVYEALRIGLAKNVDEEIRLRLEALQRRNDAYRHSDPAEIAEAPFILDDCCANLRALIDILDEKDSMQALLKCEALREHSQFESALKLLCRITDKKLAARVAKQQELCLAQDSRVRQYPVEKRRARKRAQQPA